MKAPRILIVDDDAGQRSLLHSFLKSQGFETVPVDSGARALETLRTQPFSMMISDVRMPALDGPTLVAALHERFADAAPRVVFLSGQTFDPQYGGFLADLRVPMLMKPLRPGPALEVIGRVLAS